MKAVEFQSTLTASGQIALPAEIAGEVPVGERLQVVIMWEPSAENPAWRNGGRRTFEAEYSASDAVYEQLVDDPAAG